MSAKGEETRDRILGKALELASVLGLGGLTIGGLAGELKLSKSGLFAHFQSKEKLQAAVLDAAAESFAKRVIQPALIKPRGEPRVIALFDNWLQWALSEDLPGGCIFASAASEFDDQPGVVRDKLRTLQSQWFDMTVRAAAIAVEEGHFDEATDPHQFAFEFHAIYFGFHHFHRLLKRPDAAERTQRAFQRLLRGAQTRHTKQRRRPQLDS